MRILQIHPFQKSESLSPAAGGMPRASLQLTRVLRAAGHDVRVLPIPEGVGSRVLWELAPGRSVEVLPVMDLPSGGDLRWLPSALVRIRPKPGGLRAAYYDACALTALRRAVSAFQPEIVHNHLARMPFPRLAAALRMTDRRLVLTHHHGEAGEGLAAYRRIIFPSDSLLESVTESAGIPRNIARRVYCPVHPAFSRRRPAGRKPRKGICFVGMIRKRKGIDLLLEAYRADRRLRKEPLHIFGAGPDRAMVDEAVRRDGLPVVYEAMRTPEELAERLDTAKLVVIPSRMESLCIALLEALCCGTPVVGWAPTVREMEHTLGRKVGVPFDGRTQTARELAEAILEALDGEYTRPARRGSLAREARSVFSEEAYLQGILSVYREMI
jgi:glycosyltransferase involved in cell wall biosynthesis